MKKYFCIALFSSFLTTGCQQLQSSYNDMADGLNKLSLKKISTSKNDSNLEGKSFVSTQLETICSDLKKNQFSAKEKWDGKYIEFSDKIINIEIGHDAPMAFGGKEIPVFNFRKNVVVSGHRICKIGVFTNMNDLKKYNVGDTVTVKGLVIIDNDNMVANVISVHPAELRK